MCFLFFVVVVVRPVGSSLIFLLFLIKSFCMTYFNHILPLPPTLPTSLPNQFHVLSLSKTITTTTKHENQNKKLNKIKKYQNRIKQVHKNHEVIFLSWPTTLSMECGDDGAHLGHFVAENRSSLQRSILSSPMVHPLLHMETTSHLEEHALLAFATPLLCVHTSPAIISASLKSQSCYC